MGVASVAAAGTTRIPERAQDAGLRSESAAGRTLRIGFGALWLLDGALQAQPGMFTMDMVSNIMQPAATGEPAWLSALIGWSVRIVTPHLVAFNLLVVALQLAIGVLLLCGGRPRLVRAGAALALAWGMAVWLVGEGLGQLLTGSATGLSGAPGSALLYAFAAYVLLTGGAEARVAGRSLATWAAAGVLALTAALQLNPLFFTSLGMASVFGQGAMMAQPHVLRAPIAWAADVAGASPTLVNAAVVALFALAALITLRGAQGRLGRAALAAVVLLLLAEWWLGQDLGMPFSGMETDPNTAAPLALLLVAGYLADRGTRAPAALAPPHAGARARTAVSARSGA